MARNAFKFYSSATLAIGALLATHGAASAQGNLYYMHNASAYYAWSDLSSCEIDLAGTGNSCASWANGDFCGRRIWSTQATKNVARDKLNRNDTVVLRHASGNSEFCKLQP